MSEMAFGYTLRWPMAMHRNYPEVTQRFDEIAEYNLGLKANAKGYRLTGQISYIDYFVKHVEFTNDAGELEWHEEQCVVEEATYLIRAYEQKGVRT